MTLPNRYKYTGQQYDEITQQYYLRARYYNPVIARFTQEDEYRGDGLNLYAYCDNNPVVYWDPSGYACDHKDVVGRAYKPKDRMKDDLLLNPKTNTRGAQNVTEWRRTISKNDIKQERIKFLGEDAVKVDKGTWRSLDGTRQFRTVPSDYLGKHPIGSPPVPNTPHVHFEFLGTPNAGGNKLRVLKNVHVPLI